MPSKRENPFTTSLLPGKSRPYPATPLPLLSSPLKGEGRRGERFVLLRKADRVIGLLFAAALVLGTALSANAEMPGKRNVIVLVMDGVGSAHTTISRWYKGSPLALDRMAVGKVRTYSADSTITDSAAAATAFATGHKTNGGFVGVLPDEVDMPGVPATPEELRRKPVATVLEGAKLKGKSVGIIATSNVQHASPAAYSSHWPARYDYNEIAEQQVYQDIDVVLGAGRKYLLPTSKGGARTDGEDLLEVLKARGYQLVGNREQLKKATGPKVWGMFGDKEMSYDLDRPVFAPEQPSLPEMTRRGIELLSGNKKGFFLFVEGSKVDWASHANDPVGVISEVLAFDDAVAVALEFAAKNGDTMVLAFSDHGNGGMSLGNGSTDHSFGRISVDVLVAPLRKATLTGKGVEKVLETTGAKSREGIREVMARYYGMEDLTDAEVSAIAKAPAGSVNSTIGPMISNRSVIGWTTSGHVGDDLFCYVYGLDRPVGTIDNTEIARLSARALGFDLGEIDRTLFVEAREAFSGLGAGVSIDSTDAANPVLVVQKGEMRALLPFSKDLMRIDGAGGQTEYRLEGLTIRAPETGKSYLPRQAIGIFKKHL